jgi:hypothetical protein
MPPAANIFNDQRMVRLLTAALVIAGLALGIVNAFIQDDAFISFRYARNLAEAGVLGWNIDDPVPVEGYSNFLWTLLMVIPHVLALDVEKFSQLLGLVFGAGTLLLTYRLGLICSGSPRVALAALLMLATNFSFSCYMTGGLETSLQSCLLTALACVFCTLRNHGLSPLRLLLTSLLAAALLLTRLDSALPIAVFGLATLWQILKLDGATQRKSKLVLMVVAPGALVVAAWLAWKLAYYGDVVPNTFYVKAAGPLMERVLPGAAYVGLFAWSYLLWPVLLLASVRAKAIVATPALLGLLLAVLLSLVYVVLVGGDFMEFRFLVPLLPLLFVMLAVALNQYRPLLQAAAIALVVAGSIVHAKGFAGTARIETIAMLESHLDGDCGWRAVGQGLHAVFADHSFGAGSHGPVIAVTAAGAIPYYAQLKTIDMLGLSDPWIARHGLVFGNRPGHTHFGTLAYYRKAGANLVGTMVAPAADPAEGIARETLFWMLIPDFHAAELAPASMLRLRLGAHCSIYSLYLQPHPAVEQLIANGAAKTIPLIGVASSQQGSPRP